MRQNIALLEELGDDTEDAFEAETLRRGSPPPSPPRLVHGFRFGEFE
jgi:hypothetical protein